MTSTIDVLSIIVVARGLYLDGSRISHPLKSTKGCEPLKNVMAHTTRPHTL